MNETYETPSTELFKNLKWMTLEERFEFNRVVMMYKCLHNLAPSYLQTDLINPSEIHDHFTRQTTSKQLSIPKFQTYCYKYSPIVSSIRAWYRLDSLIREASSIIHSKYYSTVLWYVRCYRYYSNCASITNQYDIPTHSYLQS